MRRAGNQHVTSSSLVASSCLRTETDYGVEAHAVKQAGSEVVAGVLESLHSFLP